MAAFFTLHYNRFEIFNIFKILVGNFQNVQKSELAFLMILPLSPPPTQNNFHHVPARKSHQITHEKPATNDSREVHKTRETRKKKWRA